MTSVDNYRKRSEAILPCGRGDKSACAIRDELSKISGHQFRLNRLDLLKDAFIYPRAFASSPYQRNLLPDKEGLKPGG